MDETTYKRRESELAEAWRAWAAQPPRRTAPQAAQRFAAMARARQSETGRWRLPWLLAAAAALVMTLALASLLLRQAPEAIVPAPGEAGLEAQLGDGEVLIWLDEETPLYMTFQVPQGLPDEADPS